MLAGVALSMLLIMHDIITFADDTYPPFCHLLEDATSTKTYLSYHVDVTITWMAEGFGAMGASEWSFSCVDTHLCVEVRFT